MLRLQEWLDGAGLEEVDHHVPGREVVQVRHAGALDGGGGEIGADITISPRILKRPLDVTASA